MAKKILKGFVKTNENNLSAESGYVYFVSKTNGDGYIQLDGSTYGKSTIWEKGDGENSAVQVGSNAVVFGNNSVAEGTSVTNAIDRGITTASTDAEIIDEWANSTPEDDKFTLVKGVGAHAEGNNGLAIGDHSHVEGNGSVAYGNSSHAEGTGSQAIGNYSHAEGLETYSIGKRSHSEGYDTYAYNKEAHAEGIKTTAGIDPSPLSEWSSATTYSKGDQVLYDEYVYTAIKNGKNHTPSGSSTYWRREEGQHAEGSKTTALKKAAHAEGLGAQANGCASHAEGSGTTANGDYSHAEGKDTQAVEWASHTEGYNTEVGGNASENAKTPDNDKVAGQMAHAEGNSTIAKGNAAHSEGRLTFAAGNDSHAEGYCTSALGAYGAHSEGDTTKAEANTSHAEGEQTWALGINSHVEGFKSKTGGSDSSNNLTADTSTTSGRNAHAEGNATLAKGLASHAEGEKTFASGVNSHAEGSYTTASGRDSHAEGSYTTASENISHAEGSYTTASGYCSHAEGSYTTTKNNAEHAEGFNNKSNKANGVFGNSGNTIHSIGIGGPGPSKNAFEVMQNGDVYVNGIGGYDGTNIESANTLQDTIEGLGGDKIINKTYAELVEMKSGSTLVPGQYYRITDYVTTTVQADTQSAGHAFDLIVLALEPDKLSEHAHAIPHSGDTYFTNAGANLNAWQIWYCLNNDTTRFAWADTTNGKGVIYRMIDEWGNDCPYDFKNIQFKRYKITSSVKCPDLIDEYGVASISDYTVNSNSPVWVYTFSMINLFEDTVDDVSVYQNKYINDEGYVPKIHDNIIGENKYDVYIATECKKLIDNVFVTDTDLSYIESDYSYGEFAGFYYNVLGNECYRNTFSDGCCNNELGNNCYDNTFGYFCTSNIFGKVCYKNTFGNECYKNTFGNECRSNTFGYNCYTNTFGAECNINYFEGTCISNTFGHGCESNGFEYGCSYNNFGNRCNSNTFGPECNHNNFGNNCHTNTFRSECDCNNFGNRCNSNTFGSECNNNNFGNICYSNIFNNGCCSNTFGNDCHTNTFGAECNYNAIGDGCDHIKFGTSATTKSYCSRNIVENGNQRIYINATGTTSFNYPFQNVKICQGVNNTTTYKTITDGNVGQTYQTVYQPANSHTINV